MSPAPNLPNPKNGRFSDEERDRLARQANERQKKEQRAKTLEWLRLLPEWLRGKLPS